MKLLFPVVEVTRLLSNLIKSGFVAFSENNALVIDTNKNHIIENIENSLLQEMTAAEESVEESAEEALAAALIRDVGLDEESEEGSITLTAGMSDGAFGISKEEAIQQSEEILLTARQEAEEIVNRAHKEAEQMRASAYDEVESIKEQAHEEGYQAGYSDGNHQVIEEYEEKKAQLDARMEQNEQFLVDKEKALIAKTEHKMVDLLCQLIPSITGVSIENERDVLLHMINMAMRDLDNSHKFVIRVSCDDYEMLSERKDEIYGALNPAIELEIYEDAKLEAMQCLIDTDNGIVDVSLDVQLNNLIKALKLLIQE